MNARLISLDHEPKHSEKITTNYEQTIKIVRSTIHPLTTSVAFESIVAEETTLDDKDAEDGNILSIYLDERFMVGMKRTME